MGKNITLVMLWGGAANMLKSAPTAANGEIPC